MISMDKKYRTRGGYACRVYAIDGAGTHPVHGGIDMGDGWRTVSWKNDGTHSEIETGLDLIEIKEPVSHKLWVNQYDTYIKTHESKGDAVRYRSETCNNTIGIELLIHDDGRKEARIIEVV